MEVKTLIDPFSWHEDTFDDTSSEDYTTTGTLIVGDMGDALPPDTDDSYDLGSSSYRWQDLFLSGTATAKRALLGGATSPLNPGSNAVGRWRLEDNAANTAVVDDVGSNNGVASENTSNLNTTGKFGDAFSFDGSNWVAWTGVTEFDFTDQFSVVIWFNTTDTSIVQYLASGNGGDKWTVSLADNAGSFRISVVTASGRTTATSADQTDGYWADGAWHLVVATYDKSLGSERLKLYVDNSKIANANGYNEDALNGASFDNVSIAEDVGGASAPLTGKLDNFMLYDDALTEGEISALWNAGAGNEDANFAAITLATIISSTDLFTFYHASDIGKDLGIEGDLEVHGNVYGGLIAATYFGNYVGFDAPILTSDTSWTLPADDGSANETFITNGSEVLSFGGHDDLADFVANEHISWVDGDGATANFKTTGTASTGALTCTTLQTHANAITSGSEISYKTAALTPLYTGIVEVISDASNLLPSGTESGIEVEAFFDPNDSVTGSFQFAGSFFNKATGTTVDIANNQRGLFGGFQGAIVNNGYNVIAFGLQFDCFNNANFDGGKALNLFTRGVSVTSYLGYNGKTVSNAAITDNRGGHFDAILDGTYDSSVAGTNCGVCAKTTDSLTDADGDITSYGLYIDALTGSTKGGGGVITSWGLYEVNGIDSFMSGDLAFGQTDKAERIGSDADGTLDLYSGGTIELHDATNIGDGTNESQFASNGTVSFAGTARIGWTKITANNITKGNGTHSGTTGDNAGYVADLQTAGDGNFYHIDEAAADPGWELTIEFTSVTAFNFVKILATYDGQSTHTAQISLYNFNNTTWDCFDSFMNQGEAEVSTAGEYTLENHDFFVPDDSDYIGTAGDAGDVRVRFRHTSGGNANDDLDIDVVALYQ